MATFDPTMTRYALRFRDGTISVRRVADDREVARFQARGDRESGVFGFSPDGRYLATSHHPEGGLTVWDVDRRSVRRERPGPRLGLAARFSPDSRRIVVAHADGEILGLRPGDRSARSGRWPRPAAAQRPGLPPGRGPDRGHRQRRRYPTCRIMDAETGRLIRSIPLPTNGDRRLEPRRRHAGDAVR